MARSPLAFIISPIVRAHGRLTRRSSHKIDFKDSRFSKKQLIVFSFIFSIVGGTILYFALAAPATKIWDTQSDLSSATLTSAIVTADGQITLAPTVSSGGASAPLDSVSSPLFGSFESSFSEFGDASCGGNKVVFLTNPVREGRYAAQLNGSNECYGSYADNLSRIHLLKLPASSTLRMDNGSAPFWWAYSLYVPNGYQNLNIYAGPEIHQPNTLDPCTFGPAPFNTQNTDGSWRIVIRGSSGCARDNFQSTAFGQTTYADCNTSNRLCRAWANGISPVIQPGQWYDFLVGFNMKTDNTGWFEAWVNGPGTNGKSVQIVPRTNLPTSFIYPGQYPMDSLYYSGVSTARSLIFDGGRLSTDFNGLKLWQDNFTKSWGSVTSYAPSGSVIVPLDAGTGSRFSGFAPTLTTALPAGSSITYEARSSCDQSSWSAWGAVGSVPDGRYLQIRANLSTTNTSVTPAIDKLGITYEAVTGVCGSGNPIINSSIESGDQITAGTTWTADITPAPSSVEFWADGSRLAVDSTSPFSYVLNLSDGSHNLGLCATIAAVRNCYGASGVYATVTSTTAPAPDTTAPSVPANLVANAVSTTTVNLSWSASNDNVAVTGYKVYRTQGVNAPILLSSSNVVTSYSDTTATESTSYTYHVTAIDAAGNESVKSVGSTATTPTPVDITAPTMPASFTTSTLLDPIRVNLEWAVSTDNVAVTGYKIYRGVGLATPSLLTMVTGGNLTSYLDSSAQSATTYKYQISAIDASGNESLKTTTQTAITPDITQPSTPTNLMATTSSPTTVNLSWAQSTDNVAVTGYKLYRGIGATAPTLIKTLGTVTSYSDTPVSASTSYIYRISAIDASGNESILSTSQSVSTPAIPDTTAPTANISAPLANAQVSGSGVKVSAVAADNVAIASVQFYLNYQGNSESNKLGPLITSATSGAYSYTWDTTSLGNGNHVLMAIAKDTSNNSVSTSSVTVTINNTVAVAADTTAPGIPGGLTVGSETTASIALSWDQSSDNPGGTGVTGYVVYQNTSNSSVAIAATDISSYVINGLQPGTNYSFSVAAIDSVGNLSAKSVAVSGKTTASSPTSQPTQPTQTAQPTSSRSTRNVIGSTSKISIRDMSVVLSSFGSRTEPYASGDLNGDGLVNITDLSILLSNYGGYL